MTTTQTPEPASGNYLVTLKVRIVASGRGFEQALRLAKKSDGRWDKESRTWTIRFLAYNDQTTQETHDEAVARFLYRSGLEVA